MAFCNCSKQKSSIFLDAAEAEVTLINDKKMDPTSTHFVFIRFVSSAVCFSFHHDASTIQLKSRRLALQRSMVVVAGGTNGKPSAGGRHNEIKVLG